MADTSTKHVDFDDNASTDGLVEDGAKAVEVLFDPSNPHRRKSSLVETEHKPGKILRKGSECIVHQFFDAQRLREELGASGAGSSVYHSGYTSPSAVVVDKQGGQTISQADETQAVDKTVAELDSSHHKNDADYQSRMLTKKQLSDMAWGVRELSRRLSSMRMRIRVKNIFLLTKIYDQELIPKTRELTRWLLDKERDTQYTVYVQDKLRSHKRFDAEGLLEEAAKSYGEDAEKGMESVRKRLRYWDEDMCRSRPHTFDFVVTLGGDGTVLYASWLFQRVVPPVLSFALGSLGFLTQLDFDDYAPTLTSALTKGVTVSLRLRFEGTVMRSQKRLDGPEVDEDGHVQRDLVEELVGVDKDNEHTHKPEGTFNILNEIVVDRGPNPTMSSTELFGDDEHFTSILADGICVSTPTGSTAYNLGAGGSLCHPENPVMLVTSVCAHTLSFRPIILPDTIVLRIGVPYDARNASWVSFDGRERVELRPGDYVTISASRYPFAVVQAENRRNEDWVTSISGKLGWNTREKQKVLSSTVIVIVAATTRRAIVPHYPEEDSKLRATTLATRRGGNCPNTLEVLQQLFSSSPTQNEIQLHLVSTLPSRSSPATASIASSFHPTPAVDFSHCLYREDHDQPASSYIMRSEATGTRTVVNHNALPEMSIREFERVAGAFSDAETWWHFEGRIPEKTIQCIRHLRTVLPSATVSVEVEKPGRHGLTTLAAEADIVFYSRSWAEDRGHVSPESCLTVEKNPTARLALCTWGSEGAAGISRSKSECFRWPATRDAEERVQVVDAVGAGDTFIAGMLYGLICHDDTECDNERHWDDEKKLSFAVNLATLKVQQEGFDGLGAVAARIT